MSSENNINDIVKLSDFYKLARNDYSAWLILAFEKYFYSDTDESRFNAFSPISSLVFTKEADLAIGIASVFSKLPVDSRQNFKLAICDVLSYKESCADDCSVFMAKELLYIARIVKLTEIHELLPDIVGNSKLGYAKYNENNTIFNLSLFTACTISAGHLQLSCLYKLVLSKAYTETYLPNQAFQVLYAMCAAKPSMLINNLQLMRNYLGTTNIDDKNYNDIGSVHYKFARMISTTINLYELSEQYFKFKFEEDAWLIRNLIGSIQEYDNGSKVLFTFINKHSPLLVNLKTNDQIYLDIKLSQMKSDNYEFLEEIIDSNDNYNLAVDYKNLVEEEEYDPLKKVLAKFS